MIKLKTLTIEGFGSIIEPQTYKLDKIGLNKIEGENGSGKTTITNALSWVLYKKLVKKGSTFKPWENIRGTDYKGTCVTLHLWDGKNKISIIRCDDYKGILKVRAGKDRLSIWINGEELLGQDLRDKKDYEKWIVNKIGYTFDLFKSTVLFAQELDRLMQEDGPSKKKIFDEAFETIFINRAKEICENKLKKLCNDFKELITSLTLSSNAVTNIKSLITQQKEHLKSFKKNIQEQIIDLGLKNGKIEVEINGAIDKIKLYKKETKFIKPFKDVIDKLNAKIDPDVVGKEFRKDMELNATKTKIEDIKDSIRILKEDYSKPSYICPTCGTKLSKQNSVEHIKKEIKLRKKVLAKLEEEEIKLKQEHKDLLVYSKVQDLYISDLRSKERGLSEILQKKRDMEMQEKLIEVWKSEIQTNKRAIQKLVERKPDKDKLAMFQKDLEIAEQNKLKLDSEEKAITKKINIQKWLLKEPLSNSGLKAFIFDSGIGSTNKHLKKYTVQIGFEMRVFIDLQSSNKDIRIIVRKSNQDVLYEDLSKGQKQLADLAVAFALHDTVTESKPINILFMDEIFENLDKNNVEKVGNMIMAKSQNKSIHLITHQSSFSPSNCRTTYVTLNELGQTILESSN